MANGGRAIGPELVARVVGTRRESDPLADLTQRELEVLSLMADGLSNRALSARLHLSAKTVETHVRSIFMKLDLAPGTADHRRVLAVLTFLRAS